MFSSNTSQVSNDATYIEDVFSTWLYTGNGSTQTITNGIDLSGKGGLVWVKARDFARDNNLFDTERGVNNRLVSNATGAQITTGGLTAFTSSGFTVDASAGQTNATGQLTASWTFRKQPKFFDVVTYTGNGAAGRAIPHSLASVPGFIVVKRTDSSGNWRVWHRSVSDGYGTLNATDPFYSGTANNAQYLFGNGTTTVAPTSTDFTVSGAAPYSELNTNGATYVAYLFAHNAGGFGLTGTDNVISCGSFTTDGSGNATVDLGYEPQYLMYKLSSGSQNWQVADVMRGFDQSTLNRLAPNTSGAETNTAGNYLFPTATGFQGNAIFSASSTYIYIAIRRGPMKVPTDGTKVFSPNAIGAVSVGTPVTTGFPVDLQIPTWRGGASSHYVYDRLRGVSSTTTEGAKSLITDSTAAETSPTTATRMWDNTGYQVDTSWSNSVSIFWNFRRAPSFFDEVCYTGTGTTFSPTHNLQATPGLVICKRRNGADSWFVYADGFGGSNARLNSSDRFGSVMNRITGATSTTFTVAGGTEVNQSGGTYVAYLFASAPGVSKIGSYTGTGTTLQINCGFTGGARFVLIKRTDTIGGDWYVWDSARGIVSGNDPYLLLNSSSAEVTNTDYVDTYSAGFEISSTAPAAINASGGSFIYLAIA